MATYINPPIVFMAQNPSVIGLAFAVNNEPPSRIDYAQGTSPQTETAVETAVASFDWVALPPPNPPGFITALKADTNIQPIYFLLAPYEYVMGTYTDANAPAIKAIWQQLINQYGSSILTSNLQTLIQNYAVTYNMPLV